MVLEFELEGEEWQEEGALEEGPVWQAE